MKNHILTPAAGIDLEEIIEYVLAQGEDRAARVLSALEEGFDLIGRAPRIGHWRKEIKDPNVRVWTVFKFLIVYDPETTPVQILRIIHGARDLTAIF